MNTLPRDFRQRCHWLACRPSGARGLGGEPLSTRRLQPASTFRECSAMPRPMHPWAWFQSPGSLGARTRLSKSVRLRLGPQLRRIHRDERIPDVDAANRPSRPLVPFRLGGAVSHTPVRNNDIVTNTPPTQAPLINCPWCGDALSYQYSIYEGGWPQERRDVFRCAAHGGLAFHHRTGALRHIASD